MDRTDNSNGAKHNRMISLALTTALAGAALTGCSSAAPPAALSANKAEIAMSKGKISQAVEHAEAAVLADPRNASYRAMLGAAYLDSGRFASAATSFADAIQLGDTTGRTALSLALALTAEGKQREAVTVLSRNEALISAGDLGLAYSLAGQPERGVNILTNALRNGETTPKIRQNLAYSYALAGRWKEARIMAAEDVPADQVPDRIAQWVVEANPAAFRERVASLLSVPANGSDAGQPVQLALANFPTGTQLALAPAAPAPQTSAPAQNTAVMAAAQPAPQASAMPVKQASAAELPPLGSPAKPSAQQQSFQTAFNAAPAAPATARNNVQMDARRFVSQPVVQPISVARASNNSTAPATSRAPVRSQARDEVFNDSNDTSGTHLVQLGSFSSEAGARRAWTIYVKRYPELANRDMVITQAVVRGKNYWRVSAAGYDAKSSRDMCGRVNSSNGDGCFAYAESRPLPGAVDSGRRFAMAMR